MCGLLEHHLASMRILICRGSAADLSPHERTVFYLLVFHLGKVELWIFADVVLVKVLVNELSQIFAQLLIEREVNAFNENLMIYQ